MIDQLYGLIGGKKTGWAAIDPFYRKAQADDASAPSLVLPIWREYAPDRAVNSSPV